jgi:hypothetical protein
VSGRCPALALTVSGRSATTDKQTKFRGMKCDEVRPGIAVAIDGTSDSSGTVNADVIQRTDGHDQ